MALSSSRLSGAIRAALLANANAQAIDNDALTALCDVLATCVLAEITGHAVVSSLGLIAPPGTGGGPVTGSGTIA